MLEHDELRALLTRVRRRWFALVVLSAIGRASAAAAVPLAAGALAAWLLAPSGAILIILTVVIAAAALAAAGYVLVRMRQRPDDRQVARFVEEQTAEAGQPPLDDAIIVANAVRALRAIDPSDVISRDAMRRAALESLGGAILLVAALVMAGPHLLRAGATAWVAVFPHSIEIAVETGDVRLPAGQPLRIAARVAGRGARLLGVVPSLVVAANGQQRTVPMSRSDTGFSFSFESVDRSFQYRVAAGSASSRSYSVTALFPPRITRIDVDYEYPAFTGQGPHTVEDNGDIFGPAGTSARLRIHADKPLKGGVLSLTDGGQVDLAAAADGTASAGLVLEKDDGYRVRMTDLDGLQGGGELEYFIRLMDDRPPDVRIVRPAADQGITPLEEIAIEARADDDHGVAHFDLVYAVAGRSPRIVPFTRVNGTDVAKVGTHLLAAEDLGVQPGDVITYYARARDVARGKRSTETRSDIFFLEVKPFNEEFVAAQSQAMGGGAAGGQIESLIAAQKEIINATWNLERRSGAGRSATDLKAVGQAQAELKARAEQMMRGGRRGGPPMFVPQQMVQPQPARRGGADPVGAAIEAMGRAVEQLDRERTAEALPHEMQALQGLLQAQAEVRRRQVMQQAASGPGQGGTSRTDRDLSALFDRELQRQQRTNYESPQSSSQATDEEEKGDALDRIRDLARRQEELARRQGEMAKAQLSEDEMKRQLEQLTREQQELREQAEALERQLQGANRERADRSQTSKPAEGGGQRWGDMRRAAEQMRTAANEMQRRNAAGAAASAVKAAEALRQTERQMRGGSADARQRAAGELQLEAQQIADGQRRIASEMARLEKDGHQANADALRRLASEKDKLADRIDELQRAARQLERDVPGPAGAPFRDAGQQLQRERIGERMRSTANDMRGRASAASPGQKPAASQAPGERQLSRALDSLVDTLGGNAEARRMTDALDQAREMRERLSQLERQVREAERNAQAARGARGQTAPQRGREGQGGSAADQLQRAREAYGRELQRSRETLGRLQSSPQQDGLGGSTPEHHEYSRSAPGNESFKQDFSGWEALRKDVDGRLERYEADITSRLASKRAEDRLSAGGSERVPEAYRQSVSRYFESLAKVKK
jgi:hypothetical protein